MACQTQTFAQVTTSLDGLVRRCSPKSELHQKLPSDYLAARRPSWSPMVHIEDASVTQ